MDGDLIAVVGPNGCGKSNIVDAILWGLGEPNARALRAATSQDVIFAGSSARKPLSYAEVTLLFDNEDRSLAIDASEVSISRRLDRQGESTYRINGQECRLKDIFDLMADSGLGRAGYAIVGQKEIDAALAASPEDRRAWIDEAAGVQRYRSKRIESLRRLKAAEDHLARVADIVQEIERQREPLREEAELARQYKTAMNSLRQIESSLLIREIYDLVHSIREIEDRQAKLQANADLEERTRQEAETEAGLRSASRRDIEAMIERDRDKLAAMRLQLQKHAASLELARHKLDDLARFESSVRQEQSSSAENEEAAQAERAEIVSELERAKAAFENLTSQYSIAEEEAKQIATELAAVESELELARLAELEAMQAEADDRHRRQRIRSIQEEIEGIAAALPDLERELAAQSEEFTTAEETVATAAEALDAARVELDASVQKLDHLERTRREVEATLARSEGRLKGLEATLETFEGMPGGAKAVLEAAQRGDLSGEYRPVALSLHVPQRLALAIETALGAAAHDLIVPGEAEAKAAVRFLKDRRLGRATFQPISMMRPQRSGPELAELLRRPGVVGLASELVECDRADRPVIESLLGRIIIVHDLDQGVALASTRGWSRLVTLEGEVIHASGAVTGGVAARPTTGFVQRKAELESVEALIESSQRQLAGIGESRDEALAAIEQGKARVVEREKAFAAAREARDEVKRWMASLDHERQQTAKSREKLVAEAEALSAAEKPVIAKIDLGALQAKREGLLRSAARWAGNTDVAAERLAEADRARISADQRLREFDRRQETAREQQLRRLQRLETIGQEREALQASIATLDESGDVSRAEIEALETALAGHLSQRQELVGQLEELGKVAADAARNQALCHDLLHQAELDRTRMDSKRAAIQARLLEEWGITEDEAVAQGGGIEIPSDAAALANKLRREVKAMGEVNLGAIDAFQRLTERYEEFQVQIDDILRGKAEIEAAMAELDRLTSQNFVSTLERVQVEFAAMFTKIFGGGEGVLSLDQPNDPLQTGVVIEVTIPGKKRQRLELLSGGERAMAASAFLFALLRVRPSPLVVLDEVDAPLDGRNVERFLECLQSFANQIQFVLITHNPVTIEAAPIWFGVTMQEPGVTAVVPCRAPAAKAAEVARESVPMAAGS